ncbi:MAG: DUF4870 domain-containing protein [Chloroflexales bacterium]
MQPVASYCPSCRNPLAPGARFCSTCGQTISQQQPYRQQQPYPPQQPISGPTYHLGGVSADERNTAMACHLVSFLGYLIPFADLIATIVIWSSKKDQSAFVREHGAEALNYQISFYIYALISLVLTFVLIGFLMLAALTIFDITVTIIAAVKASNGERYRYPLTIRFVQ